MPYVKVLGLPYRTMLGFDARPADPLLQRSFVQQELLRHGVLWNGFHNLAYAHTDADVDCVLQSYARVLEALREGVAGAPPRRKARARVPQDHQVPHATRS
jgi:glutamate-1-semialdehyde 2,1-aminomutase